MRYEEPRLRFWRYVDRKDDSECWPWLASIRNKSGYGSFEAGGKRSVLAHRMAWELSFGPIPASLCVCHTCDNPICVNPGHLFLGTKADNSADMISKGRAVNPRGSAHGNAIVNEADVVEIRSLVKIGMAQRPVAKRFGISQLHVSRIVRRLVWAHVE